MGDEDEAVTGPLRPHNSTYRLRQFAQSAEPGAGPTSAGSARRPEASLLMVRRSESTVMVQCRACERRRMFVLPSLTLQAKSSRSSESTLSTEVGASTSISAARRSLVAA